MKSFLTIFLFLAALMAIFWFGNNLNKEELIYESDSPEKTATEEKDDSKILISEIFLGNKSDPPFIELYNTGNKDKNLSGYSIGKSPIGGNESILVSSKRFNNTSIGPRGYFLISAASSTIKADAYWPKSYSLPKANAVIYLYNPSGEKIDETSWNSMPQNASLTRISWEENDFYPINAQTPQNSGGLIYLKTGAQSLK